MKIREVECLFAKVFDVQSRFTAAVTALIAKGGQRSLFLIDLAATAAVVYLVQAARRAGVKVMYIDHHKPMVVKSDRDMAYIEGLRAIEESGAVVMVKTRAEAPACLNLVPLPYAAEASDSECEVLVLGDQDIDGLLGAMGLCGLTYPGMVTDAAVLDGPRSSGAKRPS